MQTTINIKASTDQSVVIEIEGTIGIPEEQQFANKGAKVATYESLRAKLDAIAAVNAKQVVVNIRSTGGSVADAIMIYEALAALKARVTTRCYGYTASAATIIAQAASKGCREISENALYLIHNSTVETQGNAQSIDATSQLLQKTDQRIASIYASRSGKEAAHYSEIMSRNSGNGQWLSPSEAIQAALADKIITTNKLTQNRAEMEIKERWRTILQLLGVTNQHQTPQIEEHQIDSIEMELNSRAENIDLLQNRVAQLEQDNLRLKAAATATLPREDPDSVDMRPAPNREAYNNDARSFK